MNKKGSDIMAGKIDEVIRVLLDMKDRQSADSERIARIETHMQDMNGKLIKHDKHVSSVCVLKHRDVDKEIDKAKELASDDLKIVKTEVKNIRDWQIKWGTAIGTLLTVINLAVSTKALGWW